MLALTKAIVERSSLIIRLYFKYVLPALVAGIASVVVTYVKVHASSEETLRLAAAHNEQLLERSKRDREALSLMREELDLLTLMVTIPSLRQPSAISELGGAKTVRMRLQEMQTKLEKMLSVE